MQSATRRRSALTLAVGLAGATAAAAQDASLATLLECRDGASLGLPMAAVVVLAEDRGFRCRRLDRRRGESASCMASGTVRAFGHRVGEFTLADDGQGGRLLAVAFGDPPARVAAAIERARSSAATGSPLHGADLGEREDGVAELRCAQAGAGVATGAIAGALDFRGMQPVPAMRVCAAPVQRVDRPHCLQTSPGATRYRIDALAPGEYYVTAFPLSGNPNRLIAAYARPLPGCSGRACPERLQAVTVSPGQQRDGVDPLALLPGLPATLRGSAAAGR